MAQQLVMDFEVKAPPKPEPKPAHDLLYDIEREGKLEPGEAILVFDHGSRQKVKNGRSY